MRIIYSLSAIRRAQTPREHTPPFVTPSDTGDGSGNGRWGRNIRREEKDKKKKMKSG